jgi:hypothetical protein
MIRQLPAGRALVVRGGCSPVIARLPMAWHDPAYRRARHARQEIAELTPATETHPQLSRSGPPWPDAGEPGPGHGLPGGPPPGYPWEPPRDPWDTGPWDDEAGAAA